MSENKKMDVKGISVKELKERIDGGQETILIDVRNPDEYEICNIDGQLIPMSTITERFEEIPKEGTVVVHCHHGGRSKKVITWLQDTHGYENLVNLEGGIHAWSLEIDTSVAIY